MKSITVNRNIQLFGIICLLVGCVPQDAYEELQAENRQLIKELEVQKGHYKRLAHYVDSIVPILTLNHSSSIRDAVFPTIVRFNQDRPSMEEEVDSYVRKISQRDQDMVQALKGDLATLNQEGKLTDVEVRPTTIGGLQEELGQFQDFLWTHEGDSYRMILPQDKFFSFGNTTLQQSGQRILSVLGRRFINLSEYDIFIETHTDIQEASGDNSWALTSRRAANLAAFLEDLGVTSENLVTAGRGHFDPYFLPTSEDNRERNRRIEFILRPKNKN